MLTILDAAEPWIAFNRGARKADERLAGSTQVNAFYGVFFEKLPAALPGGQPEICPIPLIRG